jgi:hypothetical protein
VDTEYEGAESVDEQLGSPAFTFEKGWLAGIVVGLAIVLVALRRARRKRRSRTPEVGSTVCGSDVPS